MGDNSIIRFHARAKQLAKTRHTIIGEMHLACRNNCVMQINERRPLSLQSSTTTCTHWAIVTISDMYKYKFICIHGCMNN